MVGVRRIVTGHDRDGRSVFVIDDVVEPIALNLLPGWELASLWGDDEPPTLPAHDAFCVTTPLFPSVGGYRLCVVTLNPGMASKQFAISRDGALDEAKALLPDVLDQVDVNDPGMHTTETVDLNIILSGELFLELDDGAELRARSGDIIVQRGTRHRWHNRSCEPVQIATVMIGAHVDGALCKTHV